MIPPLRGRRSRARTKEKVDRFGQDDSVEVRGEVSVEEGEEFFGVGGVGGEFGGIFLGEVGVEHGDADKKEAEDHERGNDKAPERTGDESVAGEEKFVAEIINVAGEAEESLGIKMAAVGGNFLPEMARKFGTSVQNRAEKVEERPEDGESGGRTGIYGAEKGEESVDE